MSADRIVSLLASGTEILYGLGLGERVLAVSHECDFPEVVRGKPRVTRTRITADAASGDIDRQVREMLAAGEPLYEIDNEQICALRPDLIVTQAQCDVCAVRYQDVLSLVAERRELAGAAVVALNPASLADLLADIRRVAVAAGCPERADDYVASLQARLEAVGRRSASTPPTSRPRVVCLEWFDPLMSGGNWMPELVERAGGRPGLAEAGAHSPYVAWEEVRGFDPEVLILMPCGFDLPRTLAETPLVTRLPGWSGLSAVRQGRVFAVDGNIYFNRSGPRLVDSLELLADLISLDPAHDIPDTWRQAAKRISQEQPLYAR